MTYFLAPSLAALRDEVNKAYPKRDKSSDGWIGDPSHAARKSDHNPDWDAPGRRRGVVRALDIDVDDNDPRADVRRELLNALIGDPRVYYVISNGIIYSRTYGWVARKYTGSNKHFSHVHVSILSVERHEFDRTTPWLVRNKYRVKPGAVNLPRVQEQFRLVATGNKPTKKLVGIRRIQHALNNTYGLSLAVDGVLGPATLGAWRMHEAKVGGTGRPAVPDGVSLKALDKLSPTITKIQRRK